MPQLEGISDMGEPLKACSDYMVDLQSSLRLCRCGFPKSVHVESPQNKRRTLRPVRSLGSLQSPQEVPEAAGSGACGKFNIDLLQGFGICRCGYTKSAHIGAVPTPRAERTQENGTVRVQALKQHLQSASVVSQSAVPRFAEPATASSSRATSRPTVGKVASTLDRFESYTKQLQGQRQNADARLSNASRKTSCDEEEEEPVEDVLDIADGVTDAETSLHGSRPGSVVQSPESSQDSSLDQLSTQDAPSQDVQRACEEDADVAAQPASQEDEFLDVQRASEEDEDVSPQPASQEDEVLDHAPEVAQTAAEEEVFIELSDEDVSPQAMEAAPEGETCREADCEQEVTQTAAEEEVSIELSDQDVSPQAKEAASEGETCREADCEQAECTAEEVCSTLTEAAPEGETCREADCEQADCTAEEVCVTSTPAALEEEERAAEERLEAEERAAAARAKEVKQAAWERQRDEKKAAAKMAVEQQALEEERKKAADEEAHKQVIARQLKMEQQEQKRLRRSIEREQEALRLAESRELAARDAAAQKAVKRTSSVACGCGGKLMVTPDEMQCLKRYIPDFAEKTAAELHEELPRLRMGAWMQGSKHLFSKPAVKARARAGSGVVRCSSLPGGERTR